MGRKLIRRQFIALAALAAAPSACVLDEHIAAAPVNASAAATDGGDQADADPAAAIDAGFMGLHAIIGERPEVTGNCSALDDRAEMLDRFEPPVREQDVGAGWDFDTAADDYDDPSYGFTPNWPDAESGRFSLRLHGRIALPEGRHCLSIDIGATGTGIIDGRNACGQLYLDGGSAPLAETGYGAAAADAGTGCATVGAGGAELDIVFWYFNVLEQAILRVRHCAGSDCAPDQTIPAALVTPL